MSAVVFLPLTQGQVAVIDFEDMEKAGRVKWSAVKKRAPGGFYAMRRNGKVREWLHRRIMGFGPIDHRDNDGLNNTRENLRPGGPVFNMRAARRKSKGKTSQYRGVYWNRERSRWVASIRGESKLIFLGYFDCETLAAKAYDTAAKNLGFPPEAFNF